VRRAPLRETNRPAPSRTDAEMESVIGVEA
jgi:hypothetical protein